MTTFNQCFFLLYQMLKMNFQVAMHVWCFSGCYDATYLKQKYITTWKNCIRNCFSKAQSYAVIQILF